MKYIEKSLICETLKTTVIARFYYNEFDVGSFSKKKVVQYYECEGKVKCINEYNIKDCTCFKEMRNVEAKLSQQ